jgi:diacylglycerol kinase (ATP)
MIPLETLQPDARKVLIAVNPNAGACSRLPIAHDLANRLGQHGLHGEVITDVSELMAAAGELYATGQLRAVVAAGGDGTVSLLTNCLPPGVPLAVLPMGTENLLAKYLAVSGDPQLVCRAIVEGHFLRFDAGQAGDRLFLLMAGCGFDADVVRRVHQQRRGHIQHWSYAKPIFDSIRNYDYPPLRVYYAPADAPEGSQLTEQIEARWVFVVNLPRYAGGLCFTPDASACDGLLDVCTFREGSLWNGLMYLSGVMLGQHQAMRDCTVIRTRSLRVEAEVPAPFQLDGDPGGELPMDFRVLPGRMTLIVDRGWAEQAGFGCTNGDHAG